MEEGLEQEIEAAKVLLDGVVNARIKSTHH
jgi:hypothetical protein